MGEAATPRGSLSPGTGAGLTRCRAGSAARKDPSIHRRDVPGTRPGSQAPHNLAKGITHPAPKRRSKQLLRAKQLREKACTESDRPRSVHDDDESHLQRLPHRAGSCACAQDRRGRQDRRAPGSLSAAGSGHLPGADTCRERFSQRDLCTPRSEPSALRLARSTSGCFYQRPDESKSRRPDSEKGTSSHCVSRAQPSWGPTTLYARCRQLRKEGRGVGGGAASPRGPYWE